MIYFGIYKLFEIFLMLFQLFYLFFPTFYLGVYSLQFVQICFVSSNMNNDFGFNGLKVTINAV